MLASREVHSSGFVAGAMKRLFFVFLIFSLGGCGTGDYDHLYEQHLKELDRGARYSALWPGAVEIPGTNLVIRVPKFFTKSYNKNSIYSDDAGGDIDLERLNPVFLNPFPGLVATYEDFQKNAKEENLPVYLYLGVRELTPEGKAALEQEILAKLKAVAPDASWRSVDVPTLRGDPVVWKKLEVRMPQGFFPAGQGRAGVKKMPGDFQLWWYDTPTGVVLLGWRAEETIADQIGLGNLAELTAGTLEVKPPDAKPAEAAAPAAAPAGADAPDPAQ
jgi:hypothetical protein